MEFESIIGIEVHSELLTKTKAFCGCSTEFGGDVNTHTCPICLGLPGALPKLNKKVVEYGIKASLALNCSINKLSRMDRKNYFYPDCPKNYQITQNDYPIGKDGFIEILDDMGKNKRIKIERIHIEEDAGKLIHKDNYTLVDFNRAGVPLIEIVSSSDIRTSKEAILYLTKLKKILKFIGVSDCKMEEGSFRCDVNISVRKKGDINFGTRCEIKNINSFKSIEKALNYEFNRQVQCIENGEVIKQETRRWNENKNITEVMRKKEKSNDYRYLPEGDLSIINISDLWIEKIKNTILELPYKKEERFIKEYNISRKDAEILTLDISMTKYFEDAAKLSDDPKSICNWIIGDILKLINKENISFDNIKIKPLNLSKLVELINKNIISNSIGKTILEYMFYNGGEVSKIIEEKGLIQNNNKEEILKIADKIFIGEEENINLYKNGKKKILGYFVGKVMKETKGRANPKIVNDIIIEKLK